MPKFLPDKIFIRQFMYVQWTATEGLYEIASKYTAVVVKEMEAH